MRKVLHYANTMSTLGTIELRGSKNAESTEKNDHLNGASTLLIGKIYLRSIKKRR